MKQNDFVQLKTLDEKSLSGKVMEIKEEIAGLIVDKNMNKLKDLKTISKKRKDLAQTLTVLRQKQLIKQLEGGQILDNEESKTKKGVNK